MLILTLLLITGCSLIDDDLSVCGTDYLISYEVKLVTDIQMTIEERLTLEVEQSMADTLKRWLAPIFSDQAHDLDMNFFSCDGLDELRYHSFEVVDANQKTYTLYIPMEDYMHLAVVNTSENDQISIRGGQHSSTMALEQTDRDTLNSHATAIYTARLPMHITDKDSSQSFDVRLFMISSAVALVVDTMAFTPSDMRVLLSGTASGFEIRDSVFTFAHPSLIRTEKLGDRCFAVVCLPSADTVSVAGSPAAKMRSAENALWQLRAYVTMPDGRVTETLLNVDTPLEAGKLEIIRVNIHDDGSLQPIQNMHIGATVTLDWKEGGSHDIDV